MKNNIRELNLKTDSLQFRFLKNGFSKEEITCNTGTTYLSGTFFSGEYPNESEIERALNDIEYKFTEHKELKNNNENLVCENLLLAEMLNVTAEKVVSKTTIEEVFNKYVDCAYGEPASILGIDYSAEKLALILLVRTSMYYLGFDEITVSKQKV